LMDIITPKHANQSSAVRGRIAANHPIGN